MLHYLRNAGEVSAGAEGSLCLFHCAQTGADDALHMRDSSDCTPKVALTEVPQIQTSKVPAGARATKTVGARVISERSTDPSGRAEKHANLAGEACS